MHHDTSTSLVDTLDNRFNLCHPKKAKNKSAKSQKFETISKTYIVRHDCSQVDQLNAQSPQVLRNQFLEVFARMFEVMQRRFDRVQRWTVRNDGQVFPFL